jgi:hypothetical protein
VLRCAPVTLLLGRLRLRGSWFQASPGKKQDPISKITREKRTGGIAHTVEYLPSKHEALSSNHSIIKKKKKERKKEIKSLSF